MAELEARRLLLLFRPVGSLAGALGRLPKSSKRFADIRRLVASAPMDEPWSG